MGKNIGPKNKIARRFRTNLGLKTNPAKVARRLGQAPGVHGPKKKGVGSKSSFGRQLLEKQKAKLIYGMRERQFSRFVAEATRQHGDSAIHLLQMLEMRFDNVIYRLGIGSTRAQARQFVNHSMFTLNGKRMNVPSHLVQVGDVIALKANKEKKGPFVDLSERLSKAVLPSWLSVDPAAKTAKVLSKPIEKDFDRVFDVKLIIE